VPNGLLAGFDFATLYMAELRSGEALVEKKFEERLVSGGVLHSAHPDLRKLTGIVGRTPETLLIARGQWLAVAVGDPTAARVAEGFALRRLKKSVPALRGSALSTLPAELEQAPLRFYAPGPFLGEWARAARGLLAESSAVGVSARPVAPDGLEVVIALGGVDEGRAAEREARLLGAWEDVAQSSTGHLLGLHEPLSAPRPKAGDGYVELRVALDLMALARGLRAAVSADVSEILDVPASKPPGSSHLPTQKR
jgi:hypothetical protein